MNRQMNAATAAKGQEKAQNTRELHRHSTRSSSCPFCGCEIDSRFEICPECGGKLVSYCTFCGADLEPEDTECPECGAPVDGLTCPKCGTHNHRSFCSKCNEPLTRAAKKAVERAMEDPKLKEAREKCERAIELEAELEEALSEDSGLPDAGDTPPELSEGTRLLFEMMGKANMNLPRATPPKVSRRSREEIMKEYKQTIRDVNKIFEEMLPPAGSTPQEQRNFYSARKVAVVTTTKTRSRITIGWVCNFCGCHHSQPSECTKPELGGTWIYEEKEEITTTKEYKYL